MVLIHAESRRPVREAGGGCRSTFRDKGIPLIFLQLE